MDRVDLVESLIGIYLGTFLMLGCLWMWELLFDLRMDEVGILLSLFMALSSSICGVSLGLCLASSLRKVL